MPPGANPSPEEAAKAAFLLRTELDDLYGPNAMAVFALLLRFGLDDSTDLEDSVVDGTGDKKADIVHLDESSGTLVIAQAYVAEDETKPNPPTNKAADLNTACSWILNPADRSKLTPAMQTVAAMTETAIEDGLVSTVEVWYSHNLAHNADVDAELLQAATSANAAIGHGFGADVAQEIECRPVQVSLPELGRLYAQRTTRIAVDEQIEVPTEEWITETGSGWTAVCTSVPGEWLRELHENYGPERLFSGNIRDYLGRRRSDRNINFRIEQTAVEQPENFWAYNNGITALVEDIDADSSSHTLRVRGLSIVNGAQTTGALASASNASGVSVLARFVEVQDPDLVDEIIRANNTQNAIQASDFRSNDAHQSRLRKDFEAIPDADYAGARRGEATGVKPAAGFIGSDQAAQALAAFHGQPERAYHGKSRIWEDDAVYGHFFGDHTSAPHIVYVVSLHHAISDYKRMLRLKTPKPENQEATFQFLAQRGAVFLVMAALGKCQEIILDRAIPDRFKLSFGNLVSPQVAQGHWEPIVSSLLAFHAQLQPAAESGRIRVADVRDAAIGHFVASVDAVRANLTDSFNGFSAHVVVDE